MKFAAVLATAAIAVPLPAGPAGVQKWIKINEVEYPVPFGMHPQDYRQQLANAGIAPLVNTHPLPTASHYPRPIAAPIVRQSAPIITSYGGYYTDAVQYGQPSVQYAQPAVQYTNAFAQPALGSALQVPIWSGINNPSGNRQWVKIREGTDPIEVPAGADPQSYLESIRHSRLRFLEVSRPSEPQLQAADHRALGRKTLLAPSPVGLKSTTTTSKSVHEYWEPQGAPAARLQLPVVAGENLLGRYVVDLGVSSSTKGGYSSAPLTLGGRWAPPLVVSPNTAGKTLQLRVGGLAQGKGGRLAAPHF